MKKPNPSKILGMVGIVVAILCMTPLFVFWGMGGNVAAATPDPLRTATWLDSDIVPTLRDHRWTAVDGVTLEGTGDAGSEANPIRIESELDLARLLYFSLHPITTPTELHFQVTATIDTTYFNGFSMTWIPISITDPNANITFDGNGYFIDTNDLLLFCTDSVVVTRNMYGDLTSIPTEPPPAGFYRIRFHAGHGLFSGGANVIQSDVPVDATIPPPTTDPTRTGFDFVGWSLDAQDTTEVDTDFFPYTVTRNRTFHAVWSPRTFLVNFNIGAAATGTPTNFTSFTNTNIIPAVLTLAPLPTRVGFKLLGFNDADGRQIFTGGGTRAFNTPWNFTANQVLTAVWSPVDITTFSVTFVTGDPTIDIATQIVQQGQTAYQPVQPDRENYRFVRWEANNTAFNFNTPIVANMTIVLRWQRQHTVRILLDEYLYDDFVVDAGSSLAQFTRPEPPEGYRFASWRKWIPSDESANYYDNPTALNLPLNHIINSDLIIYAVFEEIDSSIGGDPMPDDNDGILGNDGVPLAYIIILAIIGVLILAFCIWLLMWSTNKDKDKKGDNTPPNDYAYVGEAPAGDFHYDAAPQPEVIAESPPPMADSSTVAAETLPVPEQSFDDMWESWGMEGGETTN